MSHFLVLVIGPNVEEQLAPFHEFECTGIDDQYVQDIDDTEKLRHEYEKGTERRLRDPEGKLHEPWADRFYRDPTDEEWEKMGGRRGLHGCGGGNGLSWDSKDWSDGLGYRTKVSFIPEGWEEVRVDTGEIKTFAEFVEDDYGRKSVRVGEGLDLSKAHKYGYTVVDEQGNVVKTVDRTNPNRHWDWYQVGGRYHGFFKVKPDRVIALGSPGIQTMDKDYTPPSKNQADVCMKGDIDVDAMQNDAGAKAACAYDLYSMLTQDHPKPVSWQECQRLCETGKLDEDGEPEVDWNAAREMYHGQPAVKALRADREACWFNVGDFDCTKDEYVQRARLSAITPFAVVKDGEWYERGRMGWWGVISDAKDWVGWSLQFGALFDSLSDNTLLTVVDCHI